MGPSKKKRSLTSKEWERIVRGSRDISHGLFQGVGKWHCKKKGAPIEKESSKILSPPGSQKFQRIKKLTRQEGGSNGPRSG